MARSDLDLIAIEIAERMGLPVHIILPIPVPEFAETLREQPNDRVLLLAAIAKSGGLADLNPQEVERVRQWAGGSALSGALPSMNPGWTCRVSQGSSRREDSLQDCRVEMIEAADALIAIQNQGDVGAGDQEPDVIRQARARRIAIAEIRADDQPSASIEWNPKPWAADQLMSEISQVMKQAGANHSPGRTFDHVFASLDGVASRMGGRLKNRVNTIIVLQFAAGLLATINAAFFLPRVEGHILSSRFEWNSVAILSQVVIGAQLILVSAAFLMGWTSRRTKLQAKWRQTRFAAEILRSLAETRGLLDPLYPVVSRHNPAWHRLALSCGLAAERDRSIRTVDRAIAISNYRRNRIEQQGQAYFRQLHGRASRLSANLGKIAFWAGMFAPLALLLAVFLKVFHEDWIATSKWSPVLIVILPVLLPLLAGTSASFRVVTDAGRRSERYQVVAGRLQALGEWLPTLTTSASIRRAVATVEAILLDELIEWHTASKSTGK